MFVLSINFKTADLSLREAFSFDNKKTAALFKILKLNQTEACVYLSTCNRCEIYGSGDPYKALSVFCKFAGADEYTVKSHILIYNSKRAINHLFRVCCGFESMVCGEDEILGQIKKAFEFSQKISFTNYEINESFKCAITCAKKVKTNTLISKSSVSVATIAAGVCHKFSTDNKTVMLIGAGGEIGGKVLKNLLSYDDFTILVTSRNISKKENPKSNLKYIEYSKRYSYVDEADIVISATKSPHFTILYDNLKSCIKTDKNRLFIDLAVPRDVDDEIKKITGLTLTQIDDFNKIAENNSEIKVNEMQFANDIIAEYEDELLKTLEFHKLVPTINSIKDLEIRNFIYNFRDCATANELESFITVLEKMQKNDS
ncbi:MAG: glutamyl-tRNA reductase [Clostridiales bacterium]|nr:glutamyl-tRNA reductase [Clostridiales bacterium]